MYIYKVEIYIFTQNFLGIHHERQIDTGV